MQQENKLFFAGLCSVSVLPFDPWPMSLCRQWDWHNQQGRLKDMAARTLLLKLERTGHLRLPRRRTNPSHGFHNRPVPLTTHATEPIRDRLCELQPLAVSIVQTALCSIRTLEGQVHNLTTRLDASEQRVRQLEEQVAKDFRNSSKPSSSDGFAKPKPKSLRSPGDYILVKLIRNSIDAKRAEGL